MAERVTVFPPRDRALGLGSRVRELAEAARETICSAEGDTYALPPGDGSPVLLVRGFLSGDWMLAGLKRFLCGLRYRANIARIRFNSGPTGAIVAQLDRTLAQLASMEPVLS